ncbi:DUF104 domain-containing protein [Candidatus Bathyarchaeota archaeon]|nr:DUF104 domain-containing protein [Candidatus Bathyarchaeota archaeon]
MYRDGVIKLKKRLREGERVIVIVKPRERRIKQYFGVLRDKPVDKVIGEIEGGGIY